MAHLVRPWIVRYIDPKTKKRVPKVTPGAKKVRERSAKHYAAGVPGWPPAKRVPLAKDKTVAQRMLPDLVLQAERGQAGLAGRLQGHRTRPLSEHVEAFGRKLQSKPDTTVRHVTLTLARVRAILKGCGFCFASEIDSDAVTTWLADLRTDKPIPALPDGRDAFAPSEVAAMLGVSLTALGKQATRRGFEAVGKGRARRYSRQTVEQLLALQARGVGTQTSNHYLGAFKAFCRWLVADKRLADNPVAHLSRGNATLDRRHDRRDLSPAELARVFDAAVKSATVFRGLTGNDRFHIYLAACATGFRAGELAVLTPASFRLDDDPPTAELPARVEKARRGAVQPLPPAVAETFRSYLQGKAVSTAIWPGPWHELGADMLREDLATAGVPYVINGPDGPLYADFHGMRHTFVSMLTRSGVSPKQAQKLARHRTVELTLGRYAHADLAELGEAVNRLPQLVQGASATDAPVERVAIPAPELKTLTALAAIGLALWSLAAGGGIPFGCTPGCTRIGDNSGQSDTDGDGGNRKERDG